MDGQKKFIKYYDRDDGTSSRYDKDWDGELFFTPEQMSGTFEDFLDSNEELLSGHFGLTRDYMEKFEGLKEFLGFKE